MKKITLIPTLAIIGLSLAGCGVKGKPQPPLVPALLGRGEPSFSRATENVNLKKKPIKIEGDFEDEEDATGAEENK